MREAFRPVTAVPTPSAVRSVSPEVKVTELYDAWWRFADERQRIYYRRLRGESPPWTSNSIIAEYRFTNAFRVIDRVSQYLIKNVIFGEGQSQSPDEVVFRILLFKLFNRIETWEVLKDRLGVLTFEDNPFSYIENVLNEQMEAGSPIYSAAYIMPTMKSKSVNTRKHKSHLDLLRIMISDHLGERLTETKSMAEGFRLLKSYPMVGDFLAYQYITDINYSEVTDFSEAEFVAPGPGAKEGLRKVF